MKQMRHPNIIGYQNSFIENDYINIVMTYCEGGDMYAKIKASGGKHFSENVTFFFENFSSLYVSGLLNLRSLFIIYMIRRFYIGI